MADQSDVEAAIVGVVGGALYPAGLLASCIVPTAVCRIYRGWPLPAALDADLAAGTTNISVSTQTGSGVNTTRWPDSWIVPTPVPPTLTATVAGDSVTLGGVASSGQVIAVIADAAWAAWRTRTGDTLDSVASGLAGLLGGARTASVFGATVTVPGARKLVARVEADQPSLRLARRQQHIFRVIVWCADPATRDSVGSAIDSAMAGIDFLGLVDGTSGRVRYLSSVVSDKWEDAVLYRRELSYSVDYPTTIAANLPRMAIGGTVVSEGATDVIGTLLS